MTKDSVTGLTKNELVNTLGSIATSGVLSPTTTLRLPSSYKEESGAATVICKSFFLEALGCVL